MKKKTRIILSFVMIAAVITVSIVNAIASTIYIYEGFSYTDIANNKVSICGWDNRSSDLVIPATLLDDQVSEISDMAMMDNDYLTSVDFSSSYYLDRIGLMAFKGCTGLTGTVSLPSGLSNIGTGAFQECTNIEALRFFAANADVPSQLCMGCESLSEVSISDGVKTINSYAFANCYQLNNIRIPSTVTVIHSTAFQNCSNLVISCYKDSYAHQYAENHNIKYVLIDPVVPPTEPPTESVTEAPTEPVTEPPTEPVTEAPTEMVGLMLGDSDGNGVVESIDVTLIQRYEAMLDLYTRVFKNASDVDEDGNITILDATYIKRYMTYMDTPYKIGEKIVIPE